MLQDEKMRGIKLVIHSCILVKGELVNPESIESLPKPQFEKQQSCFNCTWPLDKNMGNNNVN